MDLPNQRQAALDSYLKRQEELSSWDAQQVWESLDEESRHTLKSWAKDPNYTEQDEKLTRNLDSFPRHFIEGWLTAAPQRVIAHLSQIEHHLKVNQHYHAQALFLAGITTKSKFTQQRYTQFYPRYSGIINSLLEGGYKLGSRALITRMGTQIAQHYLTAQLKNRNRANTPTL